MNPNSSSNLLDLVVRFAEIFKPEVYLELGIQFGGTIGQVRKIAKRTIGVDIKKQCDTQWYEFYEMSTDTFFDKVKKNEIDLKSIDICFIDADHSAEAALRDFNNVFPLMIDQGLIFMHDSYPRSQNETIPTTCGTVYRAVEEIRNTRKDCEIVTLPCFPGLTIIRKCTSQLPWTK